MSDKYCSMKHFTEEAVTKKKQNLTTNTTKTVWISTVLEESCCSTPQRKLSMPSCPCHQPAWNIITNVTINKENQRQLHSLIQPLITQRQQYIWLTDPT